MSIVLTARTRRSAMAASSAAALGLTLAAGFSYTHAAKAADQPSAIARTAAQDESIRPFQIHVPDATLTDLRRRIAATRWPDKETVGDQSQGVQEAKIKALVQYWGTGYDWRKTEARLNALPHVRDHDRRRRHPVHPCAIPSPERAAADHDAWLAWLATGNRKGHRSAHGSHGVWRPGGRRLRCRHSVDARLRLLRQASRHRLGSRAHRRARGTC